MINVAKDLLQIMAEMSAQRENAMSTEIAEIKAHKAKTNYNASEPTISDLALTARHERELAHNSFAKQIKAMNEMYKLPIHGLPTLPLDPVKQLINFKNILAEEVNEIDDIINIISNSPYTYNETEEEHVKRTNLAVMTAVSDLLGDVVVYCRSEALKFGIPLEEVLNIIMKSNFSKLGADGKPIYDERNKVQKGPSYFKPEPKITKLLNAGAGIQQGNW